MLLLFSSNTIYIMLTCFILTLILIANELNVKQLKKKLLWKSENIVDVCSESGSNSNKMPSYVEGREAPGPKGKFIVGNLDVLAGYDIPYKAFSVLAEKYGKIIKLQLGNVPSLVINGVENIKEVLIYKGHHFDSRPNFKRYHMLFSGNKENCKHNTNQPSQQFFLVNFSYSFSFLIFISSSFGILRLVGRSKSTT